MSLARELVELAATVASGAAELVQERAAQGVSVAATKSSEVDVVTQADRDSETLIRQLIAEVRPDDAFLGEEGGATGTLSTGTVRWIVDPIDGTVNFLYGLPNYSVSIAAEIDGTLVAGVVCNPATGVRYSAWRDGDGLHGEVVDPLTGTPGHRPLTWGMRAPVPLSQQLVSTGFSYDAELRADQARGLVNLLPRVRDIRRQGSAALDLCQLAVGQIDAYVEVGVNPWDYAAGVLIAEAAGARWEVLPGVRDRSLVICAPAASYEEFKAAVVSAGFADTHAE